MKSILVFSNGEKIGDGIIKLPLLYEIKKRMPDIKLYWMTHAGKTVYKSRLKNIALQYIDEIYEKVDLKPFFWQKISSKYKFENMRFNYILDTQKVILRTIALKRIKSEIFISASAAGIFSNIKVTKNNNIRQYYLDDLFELLSLITPGVVENSFKINIPKKLIDELDIIFNKTNSYIGYAPGAGENEKKWNLENYIEIVKYFENKNYKSVFFLGPDDHDLKSKVKDFFPKALYPEERIKDFSGPEIVMACTKYLACSLSNDSGVSHMLSTNYSPLIKLFGPKDSKKFTPPSSMIKTIEANFFGNKEINNIPIEYVKTQMEKELFLK